MVLPLYESERMVKEFESLYARRANTARALASRNGLTPLNGASPRELNAIDAQPSMSGTSSIMDMAAPLIDHSSKNVTDLGYDDFRVESRQHTWEWPHRYVAGRDLDAGVNRAIQRPPTNGFKNIESAILRSTAWLSPRQRAMEKAAARPNAFVDERSRLDPLISPRGPGLTPLSALPALKGLRQGSGTTEVRINGMVKREIRAARLTGAPIASPNLNALGTYLMEGSDTSYKEWHESNGVRDKGAEFAMGV